MLYPLLAALIGFSACQKTQEAIAPAAMATSQSDAQESKDKDEAYKKDKTGQYVAKSVQVTSYEDGRERPTRPKYDISGDVSINNEPVEPPCGYPPYDPCPSSSTSNTTFTTSVGLGAFSSNPSGYIYALRLISGADAHINPSIGHIKLASDLNKGAGGKYIYLTFTRNPQYAYENYSGDPRGPASYTLSQPITRLTTASYTQVYYNYPFADIAPSSDYRHMYKFDDANRTSIHLDLNDGAGGKYIFGHVTRDGFYGSPIKEVGILSGTSGDIKPPTGWVKHPQDLNENAGGYFIFFCFKY